MMEFYVSGQSLKFFTPAVAADTLNYLTAKVHFTGSDWDGASKWLHFRRGDTVYDMALDENDCITADKKLNLSVGFWEIYLTGTREDSRLTTLPVILRVYASGLIDAPLHELPMSVAEQVDYNAAQALLLAQTVKNMAESGAFDGADGRSLSPFGHFESAEELAALVPEPVPGDVYSVGTEPPYDIYVWDGTNLMWRNHGQIQGSPGERGDKGVSFIPNVDTNGNISWTNDGGLANPVTRNIMGPAGRDGADGPAGPGAFEKAQEAGYSGTEATFYSALTMMPYHNRRHLPDGADPITVQTENLEDGAVTAAKVAGSARTQQHLLSVGTDWAGEAAPYTQSIPAVGILPTDRAKVFFMAPDSFAELDARQEAFSALYSVESAEDSITLYAREKPTVSFTVLCEVSRI